MHACTHVRAHAQKHKRARTRIETHTARTIAHRREADLDRAGRLTRAMMRSLRPIIIIIIIIIIVIIITIILL